jgi:hypothetical protein
LARSPFSGPEDPRLLRVHRRRLGRSGACSDGRAPGKASRRVRRDLDDPRRTVRGDGPARQACQELCRLVHLAELASGVLLRRGRSSANHHWSDSRPRPEVRGRRRVSKARHFDRAGEPARRRSRHSESLAADQERFGRFHNPPHAVSRGVEVIRCASSRRNATRQRTVALHLESSRSGSRRRATALPGGCRQIGRLHNDRCVTLRRLGCQSCRDAERHDLRA